MNSSGAYNGKHNSTATTNTVFVTVAGTPAGQSACVHVPILQQIDAPNGLASSGRFFWCADAVGLASSTNGAVWMFGTAANPTNKPAIDGGEAAANSP